MKKFIIPIIIVLAIALGWYFWASRPTPPDPTKEVVTSINDTAWRLYSYNGAAIADDNLYTLMFTGGRIFGHVCNSIRGNYQLSFDEIIGKNVTATKVSCENEYPEVPVMDLEQNILKAFEKPLVYNIEGERMTFTLPNKIKTEWKIFSHEEVISESDSTTPTAAE